MCGHLDFLWPFASQKKQINIVRYLSILGISTGLGIAILADIPIVATWQFCCLILPARFGWSACNCSGCCPGCQLIFHLAHQSACLPVLAASCHSCCRCLSVCLPACSAACSGVQPA